MSQSASPTSPNTILSPTVFAPVASVAESGLPADGRCLSGFTVTTGAPLQAGTFDAPSAAVDAPKSSFLTVRGRKRCESSITLRRRIGYSVTVHATAKTRAVMDILIAASKSALATPALVASIGEATVFNDELDLVASCRVRCELEAHGIRAESPDDGIDLKACPTAALRQVVCRVTGTYSDGERAMRIMQRCMSAAVQLRTSPVPAVHAAATRRLNDVLGAKLASLGAYDPQLPCEIARSPKAIDRFRECVMIMTVDGIFRVQKRLAAEFTNAVRALGYLDPRNGGPPVPEAGVRLLERAIEDLEPCTVSWPPVSLPNIATWTSGRPFLLATVARECGIDESLLRGQHAGWWQIARDERYRQTYGRLPPRPKAGSLIR